MSYAVVVKRQPWWEMMIRCTLAVVTAAVAAEGIEAAASSFWPGNYGDPHLLLPVMLGIMVRSSLRPGERLLSALAIALGTMLVFGFLVGLFLYTFVRTDNAGVFIEASV